MAFDINEWGLRSLLRWKTWRRGELVGDDAEGNRYFRDKRTAGSKRERRWVSFKGGKSDASRVPPEWHAWLHHQVTEAPGKDSGYRQTWQRAHQPNHTGTTLAYRPPGAITMGGERDKASGDYEPWTPG